MKKTILILVVLAAVVGGCDKYEQTLKKIYGVYTLKSYKVDAVDSLNLYYDSLGTNFNFKLDEVYNLNYLEITGYRSDGKYTDIVCGWGLESDNKTIHIQKHSGSIGTGPFKDTAIINWEIIKRRNGYFNLKTTYNNKEYEIELE